MKFPVTATQPTMQGRFQDLKKECGSGALTNICLANLGDFLKNLAQKGEGACAPPHFWICACNGHSMKTIYNINLTLVQISRTVGVWNLFFFVCSLSQIVDCCLQQ